MGATVEGRRPVLTGEERFYSARVDPYSIHPAGFFDTNGYSPLHDNRSANGHFATEKDTYFKGYPQAKFDQLTRFVELKNGGIIQTVERIIQDNVGFFMLNYPGPFTSRELGIEFMRMGFPRGEVKELIECITPDPSVVRESYRQNSEWSVYPRAPRLDPKTHTWDSRVDIQLLRNCGSMVQSTRLIFDQDRNVSVAGNLITAQEKLGGSLELSRIRGGIQDAFRMPYVSNSNTVEIANLVRAQNRQAREEYLGISR